MQAAQQAALQQQLEAWQAQEASRAAAEAIEQEKQQAQEAEQAAAWRQAEAIMEGARQKERAAWGAVSHAEAQYSALQMEAAQYVCYTIAVTFTYVCCDRAASAVMVIAAFDTDPICRGATVCMTQRYEPACLWHVWVMKATTENLSCGWANTGCYKID